MNPFDMAWAILKATKPHRQKVLPAGADKHMKLQSWANRRVAADMRARNAVAAGPEFEGLRNELMRDAVSNPDEHGLRFVNGPAITFEEEEGNRQTTLEDF